MPKHFQSLWIQCMLIMVEEKGIVSDKEVDEFVAEISKKMKGDFTPLIKRIVSDAWYGFKDDIPF